MLRLQAQAMLFATMVIVAPGAAAGVADWFAGVRGDSEFSGYLKNETSYRFREPRTFTKIRNILYGDALVPLSYHFEFKASAWAYYDVVYDLYNYDTIAARSERESIQPLNYIASLAEQKDYAEADIRELYLDVLYDAFDVRIGKQFIIWGVMTGVRIVDEINPMDFRELILLDLLDYRIPLWSVRGNLYLWGGTTLEGIWIPDLQFHRPAPSGSEWELLQTVPGTVQPETFTEENAEYGVRLRGMLFDTELALSYFYTWDDFPVIFRKVRADEVVETPEFYPTFTRIKITGLTFRRSLFGQIVKGELAYVEGKYFGYRSTVDRDLDGYVDNLGVTQADHIRWGVGVDFNVLRTEVSLGVVQWIIPVYDPGLIQDQIDTSYNIFLRKELPKRDAVFELLGLVLVNQDELYLKPKLTFNITDRLQIATGMDFFSGKKSQVGVASVDGKATEIRNIVQQYQFIGNFSHNDRFFLEFKYNF